MNEKPAETVASGGDDFEQLKQKVKSLQEADAPAVEDAEKEEDKVDERDVQLEKLRQELEKLSEDYANMSVMKNKLEA